MDIERDIDVAAAILLDLYPIYGRVVINKVASALKDEIARNNQSAVLTETNVEAMKESLIIRKNAKSDRTRLHWACFNDLRFQLVAKDSFDYPPIKIPIKTSRNLIMSSYDQLLRDIVPVQTIREYLLDLTAITVNSNSNDIKQTAIEYTCSFIASTLIFAKVSFPDFRKALMNLRIKDVSIDPCFINLRFGPSETYFRHFLPFPTSFYFYRCLLFYENQYRCMYKRKRRNATAPIFPLIHTVHGEVIFDARNDIMPIFRNWLNDKLRGSRDYSDKLRVDAFRKASIAYSTLNGISTNANSDQFPLYLLSIASRRINNYSFQNEYLFHVCPHIQQNDTSINAIKKKARRKIIEVNQSLKPIMDIIRKIYNSLGRHPSFFSRLIAADKILLTTSFSDTDLDEDNNIYNVALYARWVSSMLKDKELKKMNTFKKNASAGSKLLNILAKDDKKISDYKDTSEFTAAIKNLLPGSSTPFDDSILRFDAFLRLAVGDAYRPPDWQNLIVNGQDIVQ